MTTHFGERRVIKELLIQVDETLTLHGFVDLVGKGKVELRGQLRSFNEKYSNEMHNVKFPLIMHFKLKSVVGENELIWSPHSQWPRDRTAKEFTKYLESPQILRSLCVYKKYGELRIDGFSAPYGDLSFSVSHDIGNVVILEEKNIPGSADVGK